MKTYTEAQLAEVIEKHAKWLSGKDGGVFADLYGANLTNADLRHANLTFADLYGADLYGANLTNADLRHANLTNADLYGANLYGANLTNADLYGANLYGANLTNADLYGANLYGANLTNADLYGANLTRADLLCLGNMRNIKTIQAERWPVGYTHDTMQIGCQRHLITDWWGFSDEEIEVMDDDALEWWQAWKPILQSIIAASPAEPTGAEQ